jgi:ABC-type dipeptide/oligopeptide/nickel transport system permease component
MSATTPPTPDGEHWSADYVSSNGASAGVRNERALRLVVLAYITAVALPLIGLILGIVVATRPNKAYSRHGTWIIVLSILAGIVWIAVFASGVFTSTTNDLGY